MSRPDRHSPSHARAREVRAWIERAQAGDQEAVDALTAHFEPPLRRFVEYQMGRGTRRWAEPSDIVQVVLGSVMCDLAPSSGELDEESLRRKLFGVARWRICDEARRHRDEVGDSRHGAAGEELPGEQSTMGAVTVGDRRRWVHELIADLATDQRDVVRLRALEGLEFTEVAARLGIAPDAARMRFRRAVAALREKVKSRELEAG